MRIIIQRVNQASVTINQKLHASIQQGLLLLVGFEEEDTETDIEWGVAKIAQMRIFNDSEEKMNLSVKDINGELLAVSQFTLFADTKKGNRPSFIKAAPPAIAIPLYETFKQKMSDFLGNPIKSGIFGADMKVSLLNDGPVTILLDSKNK
jgi:D-tyrosyl-tRNA(Tyr) deacylase